MIRITNNRAAARSLTLRASQGVLALAVVLSCAGWVWESRDPFYGWAVTDPPFTPLTYAYHVFLWYNPHDTVHLAWAKQGNFSHVKQVFAWKEIQPGQNLWDWERADEVVALAEGNGVKLVARLSDAPMWAHPDLPGVQDTDYHDAPPTDPADFAHYCSAVATRYQGRISAYQIWNEPNLTREWGNAPPDAAAYVELLAACSDAIRAADPAAILISAGLSPTGNHDEIAHRDDLYLQAMYDHGFQQYVDVVGVHAPGFSNVEYGPDDAERDGNGRWATFRRVEDMRRIMVANGDAARQMAILEMGWPIRSELHPDYAWFAVKDEQTQADNLEAAYVYAATHWRPWVGLVTALYFADPAWTEADEEYWFALTNPDLSTREGFQHLQNMAKHCGDRLIPARNPASPEALGLVPADPCY